MLTEWNISTKLLTDVVGFQGLLPGLLRKTKTQFKLVKNKPSKLITNIVLCSAKYYKVFSFIR